MWSLTDCVLCATEVTNYNECSPENIGFEPNSCCHKTILVATVQWNVIQLTSSTGYWAVYRCVGKGTVESSYCFCGCFLGSDASVEVDFLGNKNVVYKCPWACIKLL